MTLLAVLVPLFGPVHFKLPETKHHRKPHVVHHKNLIAARRRRRIAFIDRIEPYAGMLGGDGWPMYWGRSAIPVCMANAESHGLLHEHSHASWGGPSGIYQIIWSTWKSNGGLRFAPAAYEASRLDQSIVASRIWDGGAGAGEWSTAAGCGY